MHERSGHTLLPLSRVASIHVSDSTKRPALVGIVLGVVNHERAVTDANLLIMQPGYHLVDFGSAASLLNFPQECAGWGVLLSICATNQTLQFVSDCTGSVWIRTADSSDIRQWIKLV